MYYKKIKKKFNISKKKIKKYLFKIHNKKKFKMILT